MWECRKCCKIVGKQKQVTLFKTWGGQNKKQNETRNYDEKKLIKDKENFIILNNGESFTIIQHTQE